MFDSHATARFERLRHEELTTFVAPGNVFTSTFYRLRQLFSQVRVVFLLTQREVRAKYKGSYLGYIWAFARPLLTLAIYYFFIGQILGVARLIPNFALYVFAGFTAWTLFSDSVSRATSSLVSNSALVKKINLPRIIFPLSGIGAAIFTAGIQFVILLIVSAFFWQSYSLEHAFVGLISILVLILFASAIGILFSAINVYLRDIEHLTEALLMILFWATPVVYSLGFVKEFLGNSLWYDIYLSNPLTLGVLGIQYSFWEPSVSQGFFPENLLSMLLGSLLVIFLLLWIADFVFSKLEKNFAQEL